MIETAAVWQWYLQSFSEITRTKNDQNSQPKSCRSLDFIRTSFISNIMADLKTK